MDGEYDHRKQDAVGAYVVFNLPSYRDECMRAHRWSSGPFKRALLKCWSRTAELSFEGEVLRASCAPEPSSILWENADFPPAARRAVKYTTCSSLSSY